MKIFFVHGFPDNPDNFKEFSKNFEEFGEVFVPEIFDESFEKSFQKLLDLVPDGATFIGHDWGAIMGYIISAKKRINLITISVPPLQIMLKNLNLKQIWYSRYILLFQFKVENMGEDWIKKYIRKLIVRWSMRGIEEKVIENMVEYSFQKFQNVLSFYRSIPDLLNEATNNLSKEITPIKIISGIYDRCISKDMFKGLDVVFLDCGHFPHLEDAENLEKEIKKTLTIGKENKKN